MESLYLTDACHVASKLYTASCVKFVLTTRNKPFLQYYKRLLLGYKRSNPEQIDLNLDLVSLVGK